MLKKMRWRLIAAAMAAFFAVIALIALLVNVVNFYVVTNNADRTLSSVLTFEARAEREPAPRGEPDGGPKGAPDGRPPAPITEFPDVEANYMTRFFFVRFDESGEVTSTSTDYIASVDEDDAMQFAKQALSRKNGRGYLKEYRYAVEQQDGETVVIFLNVSRDLQYMRSLRTLTLAVSGVSLLLVFVLVLLLSGKAIKPIAKNIERQKQFITDASHELKTPLTSIATSVDVIELEHGEDEWTDNIRTQTGRMTKLVSELVTLSKLDEELPLPNKETFSVSNAAWEIVEVYQPQAKGLGKTMTVDIQDDVTMLGEKNALQQMLSVLLDNAIRYSDEHGEIRFTLQRKRGKVRIEVFNTCQLETPPDVDRLFDRFYRPDASRATQTGGTGVGLAIAKAVAETHGGTITASCPSGKTMTIKVTL